MVGRNFRNFSFKEITQDDNGTLSISRVAGIPNINSPQPPGDISTWFLGTRAENGHEFIAKAVGHIIQYRQEYLPGDPETITDEVKASPQYQAGIRALRDAYDKLLNYLREYGTPYFSMHINGYLAALKQGLYGKTQQDILADV